MRKIVLAGLVCALAISAAGCTDKSEGKTESGVKSETESVINLGGGKESAAEVSEEKNDAELPEAKEETGNAESGTADAGNVGKASGAGLYEDLKAGNAKVKYRGTGDRTSYLETASTLEVGKSYSIDEIIKAVEKFDIYSEGENPNVSYSEIDCGQDGIPELLVDIEFGEAFHLYMIVKEIDNELVICYDQDSWDRSYVEIGSDGVIEGSGSGGAAVHIVDYSYVDAKGDYRFFYGLEETLTLLGDFYAYTSGEDYKVISSEGIDAEHYGVRDYYFEADFAKRDHYLSYFLIDDDYNDVTKDSDYDDSNELKKKFDEAGIKTYTKNDMDSMLKERAAEIGYPKAI